MSGQAQPGVNSFSQGVRQAVPVVLGYVPIGFAYGVLATAAGLPLWATGAMSVLVFAGSAQFIAVSLLDQGAPATTLIATTFLVNARHVLYGSAIGPYLRPMGRGKLAWVAAELTDETFVMSSRAANGWLASIRFPFLAGLNGTSQLSWVIGSLLGGAAGGVVGDPGRFGLDYALIAMFLGLLALQIHGRRQLAVAFAAGAVSMAFWLIDLTSLGVVVATLAASGVGLLFASPGGKGAAVRAPGERLTPEELPLDQELP